MCSASTDSAVPVVPVVSPCAHLVAGVLSDANLGVCSRLLPQQCAPACAHTCRTPATRCNTFPLPDNLGMMPFAASVSCLSPEPSSFVPLPSTLCPTKWQVPPGTLKPFSAFPFWMFSERWKRRKHVCELDVPWMFNQERQNCRGAWGWIGRCGLPRPPPSVLQLPAEPRQLLLPPSSKAWDDGPIGSDACSAGQSLPCLPHLCDQNWRVGAWVVGQRGS